MAGQTSVNIQTLIDGLRFGRFQGAVLGFCFLIALLDGYDAQIVGFVIGGMAQAWHVDRSAFGPVFSVGFAGLLLGALVLGSAADRFGRKTILILSTLTFGLFSFLTVFATSIEPLLVLRFLTGLGVGGAVPNAIALAGEYAPTSRRVTTMTIVGAGVSVGAALAGLIASQMLPRYGWQSLFYVGGLAPLVLAAFLVVLLPESLRYLVVRQRPRRTIVALVRRAAPDIAIDAATTFVVAEASRPGLPVKHLFTEGRGPLTALLWAAFLLNIAVLYTLIPWLPTLVHEMGLNVSDAAIVASIFSVGGICGGVGVGRLIDKTNPYAVLVVVLLVAALSTAAVGLIGGRFALLSAAVFVAGFCVAGGQHGANAHAGQFYPTFMRATGIGWAMGIGRIGSVLGPLLLGELLKAHWPLPDILGLFALLVAGSAVLFGVMGVVGRARAEARPPLQPAPAKTLP